MSPDSSVVLKFALGNGEEVRRELGPCLASVKSRYPSRVEDVGAMLVDWSHGEDISLFDYAPRPQVADTKSYAAGLTSGTGGP